MQKEEVKKGGGQASPKTADNLISLKEHQMRRMSEGITVIAGVAADSVAPCEHTKRLIRRPAPDRSLPNIEKDFSVSTVGRSP